MTQKAIKYLFLSTLLLVLAPIVNAQESPWGCSAPMKYENKNQVDPPFLKVTGVTGKVIDPRSSPVPLGCVGIFRDSDKKLVKRVEIDRSGRFRISGIPDGQYRLVVVVPGFCPANSRLLVSRKRGRKNVVVHMHMSEIDTCSYSDYK